MNQYFYFPRHLLYHINTMTIFIKCSTNIKQYKDLMHKDKKN